MINTGTTVLTYLIKKERWERLVTHLSLVYSPLLSPTLSFVMPEVTIFVVAFVHAAIAD